MRKLIKIAPIITLVGVALAIGILSLIPPESGFELKKDKLGHLLAYLALSANSLYFSRNLRDVLLILLFVIFYGALLEILQGMIPGREPSMLDMVANSSGVVLGVGVHKLFGLKLKKFLNS